MLKLLMISSCLWLTNGSLTMFNSANYVIYVVNTTHQPLLVVAKCQASLANFGFQFDDDSIAGCAVPVAPKLCCTTPKPAGNDTAVMHRQSCRERNVVAIADRGNCTFGLKASLAAKQFYNGIIIVNNQTSPAENMVADPLYKVSDSFLVVSVGKECGKVLTEKYNYTTDFSFILQADSNLDLTKFLLPFVIILAVCILVMLLAILIKCFRERRKLMRSRLSKGKLRQIPTRKFQKGEETDTCPICLDDFVEGDKLRVLPCNHLYHCKCVDPWLTKNRKVCPVCKRKVLPNDDDSSSDREEPRRESSENQPLLRSPDEREVGNSTFYSSFDSLPSTTVRGFVASSTSTSSLEGSPVMSSNSNAMALHSSSSGDSLIGDQPHSTSRKAKRSREKPSDDSDRFVHEFVTEPTDLDGGSQLNLIVNRGPNERFCDNDGYSASDEEKPDEISSSPRHHKTKRSGKSRAIGSATVLSESAPADLPSTSVQVHQSEEPSRVSCKREEIV